jgi:2-(1,2-epoxy-1,2-dihydrophenyl)acetyl-CoA isomerase
MQLANRLAQGPTKAIGIAKTLIYGEQHMNLEQALDHQYAYRWMTVRDGEEGRKSFIEKRQPHFTGH